MTKVNNPNKRLTKKQEALLWRRNKVLQMSMAGMSQMDIADALKISQGSVSLDISYIKEESREQLQSVITDIIPLQWRRTRMALQFIEREALQLWKNAQNDTMKMHALALFSDTYQKEFELCANSTVLDEAIKFVSTNNMKQVLEHYEQQKKEDKNDNTKEEENDLYVEFADTKEED